MIAIVDYGTGNVGSLGNMLHKIGQPSELASTPDVLERADAILLPGVGAFDRGMGNLQASGLLEPLTRRVRDEGVPVLANVAASFRAIIPDLPTPIKTTFP